MSQITVEKPPYRPWGRYVCDWDVTEVHLFNTLADAKEFAKSWRRDCNVGWLAPTLKDGSNTKPTHAEAWKQVAGRLPSTSVVDHRTSPDRNREEN